jgi:glycosyltransferase involved in cell wall biosynthesis
MQLYRLSHALADEGHHVDIVHCVDSYHLLHPGEPPAKFPEHPNVVTHELRSAFHSLSPLLTQQTGRPWLKRKSIDAALNARPYDVIHFHNISLLGPEILSLVPEHGKPVKMYTTHEHWLICPTHVLWKFNKAPCDKPDCLRCTILAKRPPQVWRYTGLLERMAGYVDQFLSPSRFTARMHADRGFRSPIACLPNFIDRVDDEWRSPQARPQAGPYFLFVGRLEVIKGLQTVIALWNRVPGFDLLVAGTGTYEPELRAMAADNPRIKFLGSQRPEELGALYYHAVACIVPSITYETFGMTNIEAFARKTPVIARDLGGLTEVVKDSGGGLLFKTDDELLEAIRRISQSPELRAELGQKGYEGFIRWWCREAHLESYFQFLNGSALRKFGSVPWS